MLHIKMFNESGGQLADIEVKNPSYLDYEFMKFAHDICHILYVGDKITIIDDETIDS